MIRNNNNKKSNCLCNTWLLTLPRDDIILYIFGKIALLRLTPVVYYISLNLNIFLWFNFWNILKVCTLYLKVNTKSTLRVTVEQKRLPLWDKLKVVIPVLLPPEQNYRCRYHGPNLSSDVTMVTMVALTMGFDFNFNK